ncbi:MAG: TIGR00295 family protein [Candidatus Bathyarchaeum sp.]|nr:MAG: TIGR00295 family protein [Candidatus Bathyarchaeum sp.]
MALKLLSDAGCSERVISHCKAVSRLAVKFAHICKNKGYEVDVDLVEVGGLLHDIGRSKTHDVSHAVEGVKIAKSLGLADSVVLIIERHIGGGIGAEEAKRLGLPVKDYFPLSLEEKLVAYADKLLSGSTVVPIEDTIEQFSRRLGENHPAIARVIKLHEEVSVLVGDWNADGNGS